MKKKDGEGAPTRRSFLSRFTGVGAVAATAPLVTSCKPLDLFAKGPDLTGFAVNKPPVPGSERFGTFDETTFNTSCGQCPAGCGIRARVVEGRVVRVEGNPKNPVNMGGIGPRGLSSVQVVYDPDRLEGPLVRQGEVLVPIEWKDALALLTTKLAMLREKGTPEKLLIMSGRERGFMLELFARFGHAFGTPNVMNGLPSHGSVLAQAVKATMGSNELPAWDWPNADYVLSLEAGFLEDSCQAVFLARASGDVKRGPNGARAKLVHLGPGFDLSAHNADEWFTITPGTSGAFALGLAHVLVKEQRYDAEYLAASVTGFEPDEATGSPGFIRFVADFSPETVGGICDVDPRVIVRIAHELADAKRPFAFIDDRSLAFSNGYETALATLALNALLGAIQRPVGGLHIEPLPPYADWPDVEPDNIAVAGLAKPRLDGAGTSRFPLARTVHETLPEVLNGHPELRPEVALLDYVNPVYARQQPERWRAALRQIPFIVSFSPFRDETVETLADLVLPDHTFLERYEDASHAPSVRKAVVGIRRPVIDPVHNTKATGDVVIEVAKALGGDVARAFKWENFFGALSDRLVGLHTSRRGTIVARSPSDFLRKIFEQGVWVDDRERELGVVNIRIRTGWQPPTWQGAPDEFPALLLVQRPAGYSIGSGANQPWLRFLRPRPGQLAWTQPITLSPEMAPPETVDGDMLTLTSPFGSLTLPCRLDKRMVEGIVVVPMGGGHKAMGRWAKDFGANPMNLVASGPAPDSGADVMCNARVRVARATEAEIRAAERPEADENQAAEKEPT